MSTIKKLYNEHRLVIYIFAFGLLLRVVGNNFGLPHYFFNSDENEYVSAAEAAVLKVPSPYKTGLPINVFYYILSAIYYVFHFFDNSHISPTFFIIGRSLSAILSAISVIFIYLIGKNLFDKRIGLVSALALAFFPVDVYIAHYIKEDVYIQFFGILSLVFLSYLQKTCKEKFALFAIISAILAGSAKLNGFFYVVPVASYLVFLDDSSVPNFKNLFLLNKYKVYLFLFILFSALTYFVSTPISFMESDPSKKYSIAALLNPEHEVTTMSSSTDGIPNIIWWPVYLITFGTGYVLTPMIVLAIIYVSRKKAKILWPYLIFSIVYTLVLLIQSQRFDRWITMVTPLFALYLSVLIAEFKNRKFIYALFAVGIIYNFALSAFFSLQLSQRDTRDYAIEFIKKNVPTSEIVFFHEALDPAKHYLQNFDYDVYDYSCRYPNREINLSEQGVIYVVINQTFADLASRFDGSEMEKAVTDCANYIKNNGDVIAYYSNPLTDNNFFGFDTFIGPSTARYLHFPKTIIVKTHPATERFRFEYTPTFAKEYSKNMKIEENGLISEKGTQAKIFGPYIPIPAGSYKATLDYVVLENPDTPTNMLMSYSVVLSDFKEPINLEITSQIRRPVIEFKIDSSSKIEFPVIFTGNAKIKFNKIILEQL